MRLAGKSNEEIEASFEIPTTPFFLGKDIDTIMKPIDSIRL